MVIRIVVKRSRYFFFYKLVYMLQIQVTTTPTVIEMSVGVNDNIEKTEFISCWWWLYAPAGYRVEIQILELGNQFSESCYWGFTEIKTGYWDWARTGYR